MSVFIFFQELRQRATGTGPCNGREGREEAGRREGKGRQKLLIVEDALGNQEMPSIERGRNWPRMALALAVPCSLLCPPPPTLPSSLHTSLLVLVIVLICMSGKALLHAQKENPSHGSVAVSALAVVRQCKIKLIKPPTQENITGN